MTTDLLNSLLQQAQVAPDLVEYLDRQEVGDAELFASMFADQVIFDYSEKKWFLYDGNVWIPDQTGRVFTLVENNLAAEYLGAAEEYRRDGNAVVSDRFMKRAKQLLHLSRIRNVVEIASHRPGMALRGKEWDTPPMLLPVSNGIIDLTNGTFRKGSPADYVRWYVPTEWDRLNSPAPHWEGTLSEIFGGDQSTVDFMQRLFGYSISGDTTEQILPILWGEGANGKSTLMDVLSIVLGEALCYTTQADSLMDVREGDGNGARPFVHALRNKRLVWASESKDGRRLNSGLVKQLTGDRHITARTLYREPITFAPTYTIFLVTNHCPRLADADDPALWRRILRIPLRERYVDHPRLPHEHKRDRQLVAKLRGEGPGILAWLVRGCLAWQAQGLNPPMSVQESTDSYRQDEDVIGQFVSARLVVGEGLKVPAASVYAEYCAWCEETGDRAMPARSFGQLLTRRFGPAEPEWTGKKTERMYRGIGLGAASRASHITELTDASQNSPLEAL